PRNPAVIADNVGDNVGDCAGMAADLFETYAVTIVATMVLASIFFTGMDAMIYPLGIGGICILASIAGSFFVKLGPGNSIMGALYKGFIVSAVLSLVGIAVITAWSIGFGTEYSVGLQTFTGASLFVCAVIGLAVTGLLIWVTEYYTGTG